MLQSKQKCFTYRKQHFHVEWGGLLDQSTTAAESTPDQVASGTIPIVSRTAWRRLVSTRVLAEQARGTIAGARCNV